MRTPENTVGEDERPLDDRRMPASGAPAPDPDGPAPGAHGLRPPSGRTAGSSRHYVRPPLSRREIEVLRCWLLSDSKSEVSAKLHVAPGTIKSHLHRIRGKYEAVGRNAGTKASLVARALQDGILTIEEL